MFCKNCGKELREGHVFCTNCGTKIEPIDQEKKTSDTSPITKDCKEKVEVDIQPEEPTVEKPITDQQSKSNETLESYVGMLVGVVGLFPAAPLAVQIILMILLRFVFGIIFKVLYALPILDNILSLFNPILYAFESFLWRLTYTNSLIHSLWLAILVASVVAACGLIYTIINRPNNDNTLRLIGVGMSASTFISALGGILPIPILSFIFGVISIVLGVEFFIKIFMNKEGLDSQFELRQDFEQLFASFKERNAVRKEQYTNPDIANYAYTEEVEVEESFFDGTGTQLFIEYLLMSVISFVTCGIGLPFMLIRIKKKKKEHTVIQGKRQTFNGTTLELLGLWIKWALLSFVTCGIYVPFATVDYTKWINAHTSYVGSSIESGTYKDSTFEANGFEYFGYSNLTRLIEFFTLGFSQPWTKSIFEKWYAKNTIIRNDRYFYDGTGSEYFVIWIVNVLLTFITCGLFKAWADVREMSYFTAHTHIDATYVAKNK